MPAAYRNTRAKGSGDRAFSQCATPLPQHIDELSDRKLVAFARFLSASGAQVFKSRLNRYEVLRFKTGIDTAAIYRDRKGWLKFAGCAATAFRAFASNSPWRAVAAGGDIDDREAIVAELIARDGHRCFYCGEIIPTGFETIEHLVPRAHGGPSHLSNLFLAHRHCNEGAGTLSAPEKIRLRELNYGLDPRISEIISQVLAEVAAETAL